MNREIIISRISDIIQSELYLRDVPYSMQEGAQEVDPESITDAAKKIVELYGNPTVVYSIKDVYRKKKDGVYYVYASLRNSKTNELLCSATLEYVFEVIKQRGHIVDNLANYVTLGYAQSSIITRE